MSELPMNFAETRASFVDCSGSAPTEVPSVPVIITREAIEAEVERLAALPTPVGGDASRCLMLPAPGWTVHNHALEGEIVDELTIQEQPLTSRWSGCCGRKA